MEDKKLSVIMNSVEALKKKGVTGIKVELEANLNRESGSYGGRGCDECYRGRRNCPDNCEEGFYECQDCDSDHEVRVTVDMVAADEDLRGRQYTTCPTCDGESIRCDECNGMGEVDCDNCSESETETPNFASASACYSWLMEKIAELTGTPYTNRANGYSDGREACETNPFEWIKFAKFYYDGSVDSELTFTVPIDNPANVLHLPKVLEAFKALGEAVGRGFVVTGAGMHIATLFSPDCTYPTRMDDYSQDQYPESNRLPEEQLRNFKRSMTQLLPALFFLATSNENSRALRYRVPQISTSAGEKYSAVTYRLGAIEYRVFDTCYDTPDMVLDDLVVVANSFKYMTDTYKSPGVDKVTPSMRFGSDSSDLLERFYQTETHLDALNIGLAALKPSYLTIKEIKQNRKFAKTKRNIGDVMTNIRKNAEVAYQEYAERSRWSVSVQEVYMRFNEMERFVSSHTTEELRTMTAEQLEAQVTERARTEARRYGERNFTDRDNYIESQINNQQRQFVGQYELSFS